MKFAALVPAICFLFTLGLFPVLAGDGPLDRATLVGMKSIGVLMFLGADVLNRDPQK
jgi:hypothetical protein